MRTWRRHMSQRSALLAWTLVLAATNTLPTRADEGVAHCGTLCLLDGSNQPLDPATSALSVSRYVTNGSTLPQGSKYDGVSLALSDLRVQADDPAASDEAFAELESRTQSGALRATVRVRLRRPRSGLPLRSPFIRLVADSVDKQARGAEQRTLLVALRDRVVVGYRGRRVTLYVGRPGNEDGPLAARQARLSIHILRQTTEGPAVIGRNDVDALEIMRAQVRSANEVWAQCGLTFGAASEVAMDVVNPPPPTMLAVADDDGLPARGGGEIRFRVDAQSIGPLATRTSATPASTAEDIAKALRAHGLVAHVSPNLPNRSAAGPGVDIVVRRSDGSFVDIEPDDEHPLSSDAQQSLKIGRVDLSDGLLEFDNMTALVGSLEERSLLKTLADDDPATIDVFIVNQFSNATRQGEAFIAEPRAAIVNAVVLDRNGLRHSPLAWTLAHEIGHVLMNDPLHPDNIGPDRPWLLMDADNGRGTVDGPKRLRAQDCQRVRDEARKAASPLLVPYDPQLARAG